MAYTPDYRGVFLRGYGSVVSTHYYTVTHSSAALGALQGDTIRNIYGSMVAQNNSGSDGGDNGLSDSTQTADTGALYGIYGSHKYTEDSRNGWGTWLQGVGFDASRIVPTANENRPINKAVRYLIKAK